MKPEEFDDLKVGAVVQLGLFTGEVVEKNFDGLKIKWNNPEVEAPDVRFYAGTMPYVYDWARQLTLVSKGQ